MNILKQIYENIIRNKKKSTTYQNFKNKIFTKKDR